MGAVVALLRAGLSDRAVERDTGVERRRVARIRAERRIPPWIPPIPEHGTRARARRGCDCAPCREAAACYASAEYARSGRSTTTAPLPAERADYLDQRRRQSLARTARVATRRGRWTAEELAIALDMTRSAEQAALELGRTRSAVEHQRARRASERTWDGPLPRGRRARPREETP